MPSTKDFKRLVRARMQKTGESYTAARAVLLRRSPRKRTPTLPAPAVDYARLAGMSNEAVKAATGCDWATWVVALDYKKAWTWQHREIAQYIHDTFKIPDWWTQGVTVGYERIKGIREIGQRLSGEYEASRSKTLPVSVSRLYRAFTDARLRKQWLPDVKLTVRKATPDRSVRITWDDGTSVEVWFTAKGANKSTVAVAHRKLTSKEAVASRKQYWGERLEALASAVSR